MNIWFLPVTTTLYVTMYCVLHQIIKPVWGYFSNNCCSSSSPFFFSSNKDVLKLPLCLCRFRLTLLWFKILWQETLRNMKVCFMIHCFCFGLLVLACLMSIDMHCSICVYGPGPAYTAYYFFFLIGNNEILLKFKFKYMLEDKMYVKQMEKSNKSYMEKSRTKNKIPIAIPFPLYPKKFLYSFQILARYFNLYAHNYVFCDLSSSLVLD